MSVRPRALITGATGGLGSAIARALAPTHELLLGGRTSSRLADLAAELSAQQWPVDLTDSAAVRASAAQVKDLAVLVHSAGVMFPARLTDSTAQQWRTSYDVNVFAAVDLTIAMLPALRRGGGDIVFVNTGLSLTPRAGLGSYSASKAALRNFADVLRIEEPALRVTSIHPGSIATEMRRSLSTHDGAGYDPDDYLQPGTVARSIADAVNLPKDGHIHQIVIRQRHDK